MPGQEIEVFVKPKFKDESGWRRPCTVISIDQDGNIDYRWQGTIWKTSAHLTRQPAPNLGIFTVSEGELIEAEEIRMLMDHTERLPDNTIDIHGSVIINGEERLTPAAEKNQMELEKLAYQVAVEKFSMT